MNESLLVILAYLIGSVPTSVWVSRYFFDVDIRHYGSGNAGATNTYRVLGSKWGTFVIADVLKGVSATSLYLLIPYYLHNELERTTFMVGLGLAGVVGHVFPVFADFRGGKGVATILGMVIGLQPLVAVCCAVVLLSILFLTRFVPLSSIVVSVGFAILMLFIYYQK